MTDTTENLVLEHLRHIRGQVDATRVEVRDLRDRVSSTDSHVAGLRRDFADAMIAIAATNVRLDRMNDRLDRIEQRLGLVDA